jgi:hypothetical protein
MMPQEKTRRRGIPNMSEAKSAVAPAPNSVRRYRRLLLWGACLAALAALAVVGFHLYNRFTANRKLEQAVADADRDDPGWRVEEIEARRSKVAPAENAATPLLQAARLIPRAWSKDLPFSVEDLPPTTALNADETEQLRKLIRPLARLVPIARQALLLKAGYVAIQWKPDFVSTPLPALEELRNLNTFLRFHADLCAREGDLEGAWLSGLTLLAVARAIGDEPGGPSQFSRMEAWRHAALSLERTLGKAPKSLNPATLAEAQRRLAEEAASSAMLPLLRGERAGFHLLLNNLEAGVIDEEQESSPLHQSYSSELSFWLLAGNTYKWDNAWLLDFYNKAVALARRPTSEQLAKFKELEATVAQGPPVVQQLKPEVLKPAERALGTRAVLACAAAAVAVERYRLAKGAWPDSLDAVVAAGLLERVPADIFDGKPLRFRKTRNGVVVYSGGPEGTYQGDALDRLEPGEMTTARYEFRLWDPEHRGNGLRPRPAEDHPPDGE